MTRPQTLAELLAAIRADYQCDTPCPPDVMCGCVEEARERAGITEDPGRG